MAGKSMRTAFIRITSINETANGTVIYDDVDIENMINMFKTWAGIQYWYIKHPADEEVSKEHWHLVFKFKNPVPFENLKRLIPYGDIESARSVKSCVQYLVHGNDVSKKQYSWDDVKTNCKDMTQYKIKSDSQNEVTLQQIIDRIDKGEIREYNQFIEIPIELWSKYKSRIENALLFYRERICMDKNREIEVVFMSGDPGTGKTTFAKRYCEMAGKSFCISSSSNDALQDYKGEDVLILDDLRDNTYEFADLLKLLDNHTKSTVKSRYHNKAFIGDMIIITSYRPITDWYFNLDKESKLQLYRRIGTWFKFSKDIIETYVYDVRMKHYVYQNRIQNIIVMPKKKKVNVAFKMFEAMGVEFSEEVNEKIDAVMSLNDNEFNNWYDENDIEEDNPFKIKKV